MTSTPLSVRTRLGAASLLAQAPTRAATRLAEPPLGSGLRPVMGERGLPVVGNTFPIVYDTVAQSRERYARYGAVSWSNVLRTDFVFVLGPEAIGEVFANRDKAFSSEEGWEHFIGPFFRGGLMLMDFDEHLHHRRIMQQAFKSDRLEAYLRHMNPVIDRELDSWDNSGQMLFHTRMKQLTLNIANEVFLGEQLGAECERLNNAFIDLVVGGQAIVRRSVPGGKWRRGMQGRELLVEYFESRVHEKRANPTDDLFSVR
jgi:cytochrome P450